MARNLKIALSMHDKSASDFLYALVITAELYMLLRSGHFLASAIKFWSLNARYLGRAGQGGKRTRHRVADPVHRAGVGVRVWRRGAVASAIRSATASSSSAGRCWPQSR